MTKYDQNHVAMFVYGVLATLVCVFLFTRYSDLPPERARMYCASQHPGGGNQVAYLKCLNRKSGP